MVSHLVYGEDPTNDHLCLGTDERGKDEPWAVTEDKVGRHVERLEVLGSAWSGRYWDLGGREGGKRMEEGIERVSEGVSE